MIANRFTGHGLRAIMRCGALLARSVNLGSVGTSHPDATKTGLFFVGALSAFFDQDR
jgi:hypothetical protein